MPIAKSALASPVVPSPRGDVVDRGRSYLGDSSPASVESGVTQGRSEQVRRILSTTGMGSVLRPGRRRNSPLSGPAGMLIDAGNLAKC